VDGEMQSASALEDEVRQFRLLLNGVTDYAIYMLDKDGHIKTWNQGGERIKGYSPQEIEGRQGFVRKTAESALTP
jgi:PAS domain S-box-containing protein